MHYENLIFCIDFQGEPIVSEAWHETTFDGLQESTIVKLALEGKGANCLTYGCRSDDKVPFCVLAIEGEGFTLKSTKISFPSMKGYEIVASGQGRYTITLAFMKN